jgi:hypothetical protein
MPKSASSATKCPSPARRNQIVKDARPHPDLIPSVSAWLRRDRAEANGEGGQGEGTAIVRLVCANDYPANPVVRTFKKPANDSPSHSLAHRMGEGGRRPGEGCSGRDEGGRNDSESPARFWSAPVLWRFRLPVARAKSGRGLPHSKTQAQFSSPLPMAPFGEFSPDLTEFQK